MPLVIAISGPPGSGKSSLAKKIFEQLSQHSYNATIIDIDDYQRITTAPIEALNAWQKDGANYDDFIIDKLPDDLATLKSGGSIQHPLNKTTITASGPIIFETHFGKAHQATGRHIDYSIWLDLPLDIALSRNIQLFCRDFLDDPQHHTQQIQWLSDYLNNYIDIVRTTLVSQMNRVKSEADISLDATQSINHIAEQAVNHLTKIL